MQFASSIVSAVLQPYYMGVGAITTHDTHGVNAVRSYTLSLGVARTMLHTVHEAILDQRRPQAWQYSLCRCTVLMAAALDCETCMACVQLTAVVASVWQAVIVQHVTAAVALLLLCFAITCIYGSFVLFHCDMAPLHTAPTNTEELAYAWGLAACASAAAETSMCSTHIAPASLDCDCAACGAFGIGMYDRLCATVNVWHIVVSRTGYNCSTRELCGRLARFPGMAC